MQVKRFDEQHALNRAFAEDVVRQVESGARVIALSGGESPRGVYDLLGSGPLQERLARFALCWIVADERFVDPDDQRSNRRMIEKTLFRDGISPGHRFLYFETRGVDASTSAQMLEEEWIRAGVTGLDLAVLGVGDDGHTASLFPAHEVLGEKSRIASEVWAAHLDMWRVTLTLPVLRGAKSKMVLAPGTRKLAVVSRVENGDDLPIARIASDERSTWYVAASSAT